MRRLGFRSLVFGFVVCMVRALGQPAAANKVAVDLTAFQGGPDFSAEHSEAENVLRLRWRIGGDEFGALTLNLQPGQPLIALLGQARAGEAERAFLKNVNPVTLLTIGERDLKNPAGWVAFFDHVPARGHRTVAAVLKKTNVRVSTFGARTMVRIGDVTAGAFRGALELSVWRNSPLLFIETVVSTDEDARAIVYDAGLVAPPAAGPAAVWLDPHATTYSQLVPGPAWKSLGWLDPQGNFVRKNAELNHVAEPLKVSRRVLVARNDAGSVAVFPPPHQYFYPLDSANNLGFVWYGAGRNEPMSGYGFGIHQPLDGDKIWVPWFNAPPRTEQRLGVFYLISSRDAGPAIEEVSRFTRGDRFKKLPGFATFTSHYHIEHTLEFVKAQTDQRTRGVPAGLETPGFVKTFKARGVDIVHLAEFHVGATPRMPAKDRLPLLKTLHEECARLSDGELLVLPGEEPNVHLGGHWISLFPKPVYWILNRAKDAPFVEEVPGYGTVYHVGSADDVLQLMEKERGLMWTAHARIKGSRGFPDMYWDAPFFRSERFLGAAWKAMPGDLSQPRLGARVLDLLDDMANAGMKKFAPGEADLFRMEPDYESYAHLNVNYLKLDRVPRFGEGWQPVLDALRGGKFFVSTGEVLIPEFTVAGKGSGETVDSAAEDAVTLRAKLEWTFPLSFAEIVSGDGKKVYRQRIDLADTENFGTRGLEVRVALKNRTWVRLEVWDCARNGAFTQPVWLK
jgi:hypothetical protein